jgi:sulfate permease, SulP family
MPRRSLARLYRDEFTGYSLAKFQQDLLAGLTVAAVALPLALAFGVASGASAAAGLVTAILAGSSWVCSRARPSRSADPQARCPRC